MFSNISEFFKNSETILWARLTTVVGVMATTITYIDPNLLQAVLTPDTFALYLVINGVATEYLRRRRDDKMK